MEKDYFLLKDKKEEIESKFSVKNGWLKIYQDNSENRADTAEVYCCLISNDKLGKYNDDYFWPFYMGSEGKPSVYADNTYKTNAEEGLEPFLFCKSFSLEESSIKYVDVAEEFILYFRLYEQGSDKENRSFYFVNACGELDEVLKIQHGLIKVKMKYIKEYITLRGMNFVVCYNFMRLLEETPSDWNIEEKEDLVKESDFIYSHLVRKVCNVTQSWISGKVFIKPNENKTTHFDSDKSENESYIVGVDNEGRLIHENCGESDRNRFRLTFFKKEVLDKYYYEPTKFKVDGFSVSSRFFNLKIDNNVDDFIPVFLADLRVLPIKEQLHWKQYNIPPRDGLGMSSTYYRTMIEGDWAENPDTVDLFFKSKYASVNKSWEDKFGWKLYKPLSKKDEYLLTALHRISSNNVKAFCEQTLTIVKLTIDRLNEKELEKGLILEPNVKGIGKFEAFLNSHRLRTPDMFEFLHNLQSLRSGLIAHTFSESNKKCAKSIRYFGIEDQNYAEVLEEIFLKSVRTLNTLEQYFELKT